LKDKKAETAATTTVAVHLLLIIAENKHLAKQLSLFRYFKKKALKREK